ncbi:MAG: class I SAM-dependent methyltransferase [Prolixibacteraceae bacterium]|jgi:SAM-dependent methyltransferase|nr:class I SAM-dependent methyltransferase [Prolixibacteraceae bacterium]
MNALKIEIPYEIDSPERTLHHKKILLEKKFMRELYTEWYQFFKDQIKELPQGKTLEIGSGGGFLKDILPEVITSDVIPLPTNDMTLSALDMPFNDHELNAIVMVDTFHHLPDCEQFLKEASRTLKNGGKILMVEPANSLWGRFIYTNFHHEPFNPKGGWTFPSSGPLSDANGALPWIILKRDRELFEEKFPMLHISKMKNHTPLRYLLSGGFTLKQLMPDFMYQPIKAFEKIMSPIQAFSMFSTIVIEKRDDQ